MRVLFCTFPARTHFMLLVPLAWALRTAGHDVRVAAQPDFADTITQAGLTAVPLGGNEKLWELLMRVPNWLSDKPGLVPPYDAVERPVEDLAFDDLVAGYDRQVTRWHKPANNPMVDELVQFARSWQPDLVVTETSTYAGSLAAGACGATLVRMITGPDVFGYTRQQFHRLSPAASDSDDGLPTPDPLRDWLDSFADRLGFPFAESMTVGQATVTPVVPSLSVDAGLDYLPMRFTQYGGTAVIPDWVWQLPSRPRVVFTVGLTRADNDLAAGFDLREPLRQLADSGLEVIAILSRRDAANIGELPDSVRVTGYVPLDALIPSCSAVVHHGGFGTMATAVSHGIPQVVLPDDDDEPLLARKLASAGAGLWLSPDDVTGTSLSDAVGQVVAGGSFAEAAARLRAEHLAMPTPGEVADQLTDLVQRSLIGGPTRPFGSPSATSPTTPPTAPSPALSTAAAAPTPRT